MRSLLWIAALLPAIARAEDPPPDPPPEPEATELPAPTPVERYRPLSAREDRSERLRKGSGYLIGVGAGIIMVGGVGGLVSASQIGPCYADGPCGQESLFGRVAVPIVVGTGLGIAVGGIVMQAVARRGRPPRIGFVPMLGVDGVGGAIVGRFGSRGRLDAIGNRVKGRGFGEASPGG